MTYDVLIGVHGYTKCKHGKNQKFVILDRLNGAFEAAKKYENIGAKIGIVYLGDSIEKEEIIIKHTIDIAQKKS